MVGKIVGVQIGENSSAFQKKSQNESGSQKLKIAPLTWISSDKLWHHTIHHFKGLTCFLNESDQI